MCVATKAWSELSGHVPHAEGLDLLALAVISCQRNSYRIYCHVRLVHGMAFPSHAIPSHLWLVGLARSDD